MILPRYRELMSWPLISWWASLWPCGIKWLIFHLYLVWGFNSAGFQFFTYLTRNCENFKHPQAKVRKFINCFQWHPNGVLNPPRFVDFLVQALGRRVCGIDLTENLILGIFVCRRPCCIALTEDLCDFRHLCRTKRMRYCLDWIFWNLVWGKLS